MDVRLCEPSSPKEGYVFIANLKDLPKGKGRVFKIQGKSLAVFRIDDRCFVINNICPHQGASLGNGRLKGFVVSCPWHHQQFDIRTGFGPDGGGYCVVNYDVQIDKGRVFFCPQKRDWFTGE
ncbi:MAG: Rieske 2Fe-2S domain-containing protein [Nitrospirota bacterium]|nr:Rieske 2Fe-2S domain-containing protein [Nitrospirota bacterium]